MNSFQFQLCENAIFMFGLKLTVMLGIFWIGYLAMSNASPLWKSRFWRFGVAMTLLVALLNFLPPQLEFSVSQLQTAKEEALFVADASRTQWAIPTAVEVVHSTSEPAEFDLSNTSHQEKVQTTPSSSPLLDSVFGFLDIRVVLVFVWLFGVGVLLVRWSLVAARTWSICRKCTPMEEDVDAALASVVNSLGIKSSPAIFKAPTDSPCLVYCPTPLILLPQNFDVQCDNTIKAVLAHELVHLKRRDWFWNIAFGLLETILWFHPLVWRIRNTHLSDCENACDDHAAEVSGGRLVYQQVLAQVALNKVTGAAICGLSMARKPEIMLRLHRLDLPVTDFNLKKLFSVLTLATLLVSAVSTVGIFPTEQDADSLDSEQRSEDDFSFRLRLSAEQLEAVTVTLRCAYSNQKKPIKSSIQPDSDGWCRGKLETDSLTSLTIICRAPELVPFAITRHSRNRKIVLPVEKTIDFAEGYPLSGIVVNSNGDPIRNAVVDVDMKAQDSWDRSRHFDLAVVETDLEGRWTVRNVPWALKAAGVNVRVSHPDYPSGWASVPQYPTEDAISKMTLLRGVRVSGIVVDAEGKPVEGARVTLGHQQSGILPKPPEDLTDTKGRFKLENCQPGSRFIVASKSGLAPELIDLKVSENQAKNDVVRLSLGPGRKIKGQLVDQNGNPASDVTVAVQQWRKDHSLGFNTRTDDQGRFEWKNAPEDSVWFTFAGKKHRLIIFHEFKPDEKEKQILLHTQQTVRIKLVDAETGEMVREAHVMRGLKFDEVRDDVSWDGSWTPFVDGELSFTFRRSVPETWLKIMSQGYQNRIEKFKLGEDDKDVTLKLQPVVSGENADWTPVREAIRKGDIPMVEEAAALNLRKLGAVVGQNERGLWSVKIVGSLSIPSAMFGVPNIIEQPDKAQWKGGLPELEVLQDFDEVALAIDGFRLDDELLTQLALAKSIVSLDLDSCSMELTDKGCAQLARLKSLRVLKLDGHWQRFPAKAIEAMSQLPNLESLSFDGCGAYHMDDQTLEGRLSKIAGLKQLTLNNDDGFESVVGKEIAELKQLESLTVRGRQLDDHFVDHIADLPLLKLDLSMTGITDVGLRKIASSFPKMRQLNIERTGITEDGIRSISSQLPKLRRLVVERMQNEQVLKDFHRQHKDCLIFPMTYTASGVMSSGPLKFDEE